MICLSSGSRTWIGLTPRDLERLQKGRTVTLGTRNAVIVFQGMSNERMVHTLRDRGLVDEAEAHRALMYLRQLQRTPG